MSEQVFYNFVTVRGTIQDYGFPEWRDDKKMGQLTLKVNDNNAYIDIHNSRKATTNQVVKFFKEIEKGQKIQIRGRLDENEYDGKLNRRVKVFAGKNPIEYNLLSQDDEEKYVAKIAGNVFQIPELRYEPSLERFSGNNIPVLEFPVAIFNLYNRETQENDLTVEEVILNEMKNNLEYGVDNDIYDKDEQEKIKKIIKKTEDNDIETQYKCLNKFMQLFNPNFFNITILNLTAYKDVAEDLSEGIEMLDNIDMGVRVNNFQDLDEFGTTVGYVNEIEVVKVYDINKYFEENFEEDDDDFFDNI